ncbi:MAG: hypothetical protein EXX96DRAFT_617057 [Benjaminiella poitrasii]|nr:MAG: hypothetical protein EXX96DRAFT_617057 [Benjaminiella poitrasii]
MDEQGRIVDEEGRDAMEWEEEQSPEQNSVDEGLDAEMEEAARVVKTQKKHYNSYSSKQKLLFVYYNRVKLFNAVKSNRLAGGIAERTAQKWAKRLKKDKDWNILETQTNKVNRPKTQLDERHKIHLLNFYYDNSQARIVDAVSSLMSVPCI